MVIGKYEILDELGKGGFGVVYKARDITLDRIVALKVLHSQLTFDDRFVQYFEREARSLAKIDHPNVVTIHEIGNFEGQVFIAMRYLPGGSLSEKLKQQGPLGQQEAFAIFDQICQGLMAGHKRSVVHRDVKPGNILFDDSGQAIVADFSIAKAVQMSTVVATTGSLGFAGTPSYMPPEMWDEGVVTPAVDQYSLACVLFEMLTGRKLFEGETTSKIMHSHFSPVILPETMPVGLRSILKKALAFEPGDRFSSIDEFRRAIETYAKNGLIPSATPVITPLVEPSAYRREEIANQPKKQASGITQQAKQLKRLPPLFVWIMGGALVISLPIFFLTRAERTPAMLPVEGESPTQMGLSPQLYASSVYLEDKMNASATQVMTQSTSIPSGLTEKTAEATVSANQPSELSPSVVPTHELTATSEPVTRSQPYYTEEFERFPEDWYSEVPPDLEELTDISVIEGKLNFAVESGNWDSSRNAYMLYKAYTYNNVYIETSVKEKDSDNYSIRLVCHFSDTGYYQVEFGDSGFYSVHAYKFSILQGSLASGASRHIHKRSESNTFAMSCEGNRIKVFINDILVREVTDNKYNLPEGLIGIGVFHDPARSHIVEFDYVLIDAP